MLERKEKRRDRRHCDVFGVNPSRKDSLFPSYVRMRSDALARMRHSTGATGHDAMRRTVIVFYWCHAVPSRPSLARPTSKATIPATSASEAARRVACRKWSHRCRVLINQISTAIMRHSDLFQRSVCL